MTGRPSAVVAAICALFAFACGEEELAPDPTHSAASDSELALTAVLSADLIDKSLLVIDPSVVDSPNAQSRLDNADASGLGPWAFGNLMAQISGKLDPSVHTERFLSQLASAQTVNTFAVEPVLPFFSEPNPIERALARWCRTPSGNLDLSKSPFRLMAIVNRLDLRQRATEAGELRFIYTLLETDDSCANATNDDAITPTVVGSSPLAIIFEFQQLGSTCASVQSLAGSWRSLAAMSFGPAYNAALVNLTNRTLTYRSSTRVNRSLLNHLRTNEAITPSEWTLKEFKLGGLAPLGNGAEWLQLAPPAASPDLSLNDTPELATWTSQNKTRAAAGTLSTRAVPLTQNGKPFGGAESRTFRNVVVNGLTDPATTFQTCGGCHSHGAIGAHVGLSAGQSSSVGRAVGARAAVSAFVTDLELPRRVAALTALADSTACATVTAAGPASQIQPDQVSPGEPFYTNALAVPAAGTTLGHTLALVRTDVAGPVLATKTLPRSSALTTQTWTAPSTIGTYEVQLLSPQGTLLARSQPLSVETNAQFAVTPGGGWVAKGTAFTAFWSGPYPHDANDRVGWFLAGSPSSQALTSVAVGTGSRSTTIESSGTVQLTAPSVVGDYELRYVRSGSGAVAAVSFPIHVF